MAIDPLVSRELVDYLESVLMEIREHASVLPLEVSSVLVETVDSALQNLAQSMPSDSSDQSAFLMELSNIYKDSITLVNQSNVAKQLVTLENASEANVDDVNMLDEATNDLYEVLTGVLGDAGVQVPHNEEKNSWLPNRPVGESSGYEHTWHFGPDMMDTVLKEPKPVKLDEESALQHESFNKYLKDNNS